MPIPVLVVDDDPITGSLTMELLKDGGFEADLLMNSLMAIDALRQKAYPLVLLDILMPGIDGLTLCHKIKSDPELKNTRVIMVSGKSFDADKKRAYEYGADLFIEKPYDVINFAEMVRAVADKKDVPPPTPSTVPELQALSAPDPVIQVDIWGCRSAAMHTDSRYGVQSPCVSVKIDDTLIVFDGGSGIKALGQQLVKESSRELWLFMTHFHKTHVEGLGAFAPAQRSDFTLHVSGANEPDKGLQPLLEEGFFISLSGQASIDAQFELHQMLEESYEVLPGIVMTSFYANHPGTTLGFILEAKGRKIVYCPDSEIYGETATALQDYDEKLGKLCAGADLLIHDARYTMEDHSTHKNTGHSSFAGAVDCAGKNGVKRLLLFHQDANYNDAQLDAMGAAAAARVAEKGYATICALAREGARIGV